MDQQISKGEEAVCCSNVQLFMNLKQHQEGAGQGNCVSGYLEAIHTRKWAQVNRLYYVKIMTFLKKHAIFFWYTCNFFEARVL